MEVYSTNPFQVEQEAPLILVVLPLEVLVANPSRVGLEEHPSQEVLVVHPLGEPVANPFLEALVELLIQVVHPLEERVANPS